ncbi:dihydroxy-acid dehydratase [Pusillibacter faecalis]|uniref:dihydroxy-acid dehydratase n=1 Tax=Pusillibacter faecalis TaxID=2714358 RepID=UPI00210EE1CA|nr:dihydroxy-acid dehydratase [Pusillibacter faecalis]MCQ5026199.1 dihydroxy-acid dehydratase [Oscillibacter valericigenes]
MYNMKKERSYWEGTHAANRRIMYLAAGYEQEDIVKKPHIGIANTFFEGSPGTGHLRSLAESVKKGIWMNGGMPMEFGVPATCGNIATGSDGLRYELVLRDIVAMSIEAVVRVHKLDGLVILASCDNVIAGAYLAALRVHIPCIVVTGGIMGAGSYCGQALVQADVDVAAIRGDSELLDIVQEHVCPSFGACPSMGTACTMQILGEALNLVLPGTSTIPAADNLKLRSCVRAGRFIVEQVRRGICPEDLMSREVLFNTVMLDLAIAGSTNAVLHLLAYSQELGLGLTLDDFDRIARRIKCLVGVVPSGRHTVIDLDRAGGVPAVMKRLETELYTGETTLLGNTWGEYLTGVQVPDDSIIHPLQAPLSDIAGMRILRGNLAEEGAVCRPTGVPESMRAFSGRARVFDQEELAAEAVMRDEIQAGDVIVLRYEGPKGSPGMNELMKVTDRLIAKGMEQTVALITDGRFSGFNHGTIIGHVAPEAMAGGLIAFVEDGDIITYSIPEGILQLEVTEDVIAERKQRWKKPEPKIKSGVLALYGATCRPASEGAAMQNW